MESDDGYGDLIREIELPIFEIDVNQRPARVDGGAPYVAGALPIVIVDCRFWWRRRRRGDVRRVAEAQLDAYNFAPGCPASAAAHEAIDCGNVSVTGGLA
jgi:hypothetical protein